MSKKWEQGICNEKSGFLFSHACPRGAETSCEGCKKPVCTDHSKDHDGRVLCTACIKKADSGDRTDATTRRRTHYYDDPYFYSGYHYVGYGHYGTGYWGSSTYHTLSHDDANDFTEADAESLVDEGGESFESDMSES